MFDFTHQARLDKLPIVLVEHDTDDHELIRKALLAANIPNPARFFGNGQDVLTYLQAGAEEPFLLLCDVRMPVMDGFELRDQIDADPRLREKAIPLVFFSTWANKELIERAYRGTVQGYHRKGNTFDELKAELNLIVTYWKHCYNPKSFPP